MSNILNFNVGIVGHIDSGKTSLAKALSTTASTASFDKNPQSQERGITIDLGFSSFAVDFPEHLDGGRDFQKLQFTLVDCPGHASLIRTIIGGAQIIDMMLLVVDVTKGMQTQTAECLVLGEITTSKMVVALNKIDQLPEDKKDVKISSMIKKLEKTLEKTVFAGCSIIPVAAKPGGPEVSCEPVGLKELTAAIGQATYIPNRSTKGPFIFAVDHCFSIRGQGTILTGTVVSGSISVGNNIEVPSIKEVRKVKSIQMFRKPREMAVQGDRVGICVTQFDPKLVERGLVCSPGALPIHYASIIRVNPITYYKGSILTKAKFHISLGHETVMGNCHFFGTDNTNAVENGQIFDWTSEYAHQDELRRKLIIAGQAELPSGQQFALLQFERPVTAPLDCLVIGSKLDADIHQNACRLAFHGRLLHGFEEKDYAASVLPNLRIFKLKQKEGTIERMLDQYSVIVRSLFKKETNVQIFAGLMVKLATGETGSIEGTFGTSGKIKIRIPEGLQESTMIILAKEKKPKSGPKTPLTNVAAGGTEPIKVTLLFKRYVYDQKKKVVQA